MKSPRFFSILLSGLLIALIVLSGPSYGIDIFINGLSLHAKNQTVPFSVVANLIQDELVPINYFNLTITYPNSTKTTCQIFPNGTIAGCNFIKFNQLTSSGGYGYGYGYGYESNTSYYLGYGYGYTGPGTIELQLYLNTSFLPIGNHKIKADIYAGTNQTHLFSSSTSEFYISQFTTTTTTLTSTTTTSTTTPTTTSTTTSTTTTSTTTTSTTTPTTSTTTSTTSTTTSTTPVTTTSTTTSTTTTSTTTSTTPVTTTSTTTTLPSICNGKAFANCLFYEQCQWVGDTRLGKCVEKQTTTTTVVTTTTETVTPTSTTTSITPTTTTVASICDGKGFVNCILMSQCRWVGDTKTGKCVIDPNYLPTTTTTETTVTTTTVIPVNCYSKPLFSCIINSECRWVGDLRLGSCHPK